MLSLAGNIDTILSSKLKVGRNNSAVHLMPPRSGNTVVIQGLHVKFHEAFTGKTNTANVYTDIELAKVKVG